MSPPTKFHICREKYKSFLRFVIVGGINTGVDFLVFTLLNLLGVNYLLCQLAGYGAGILNSFILNKLWTFEASRSKFNTSLQFLKFAGTNLVTLGISMLGLRFLNGSLHMDLLAAKAIVTLFIQALNYMAYKHFVFGKS